MSLENYPSFLLDFSECEMSIEEKHFYEFGSFRLDVAERQLLNGGVPVSLTPKAFDVLAALVERSGHLVEKDELLRLVWSDSFVEEANVARIVHTLRKVLGEDNNGNKFIETVSKRGYRFVGSVRADENKSANFFDAPSEATAEKSRYEGSFDKKNAIPDTNAFLAPGIKPQTATRVAAALDISNGGSKIRQRKLLIFGVCAVLVLIICGFAFRRFAQIRQDDSAFGKITLNRLTISGKARLVALSPDGNLIAFVTAEREGNGLLVRQVGMSNTINVVPPRSGEFVCLTFSADGKLIYYSFFPGDKMEAEFYSVPALGGISQKIPNFIILSMSVAPDGKHFVNTTSDTGGGRTGLEIKNFADGEKRQLITRKMPSHFSVWDKFVRGRPTGKSSPPSEMMQMNRAAIQLSSA